MKNKILLLAAIAFSVNANSQNTCSSNCGQSKSLPAFESDKMLSMYRNIKSNRFSPIDNQWMSGYKIVTLPNAITCYEMKDNKMVTVINGTNTSMSENTVLQNGTLVMPYGAVITRSGEIAHLKNGESINADGVLGRNQKVSTTKELATL